MSSSLGRARGVSEIGPDQRLNWGQERLELEEDRSPGEQGTGGEAKGSRGRVQKGKHKHVLYLKK